MKKGKEIEIMSEQHWLKTLVLQTSLLIERRKVNKQVKDLWETSG